MLSVVIHFRWFNFGAIFTYGDWWYKYPQSIASAYDLSSWQSFEQFGLGAVNINFLPLGYASVHLITSSFAYWEKIVFFIPLTIITPLTSYFLAKRYSPPKFAALGSIFYTYNTYFLVRQADQLNIAVAYAIAPLLILLFIKLFDEDKNPKNKSKYVTPVVASLAFLFCSIYEIRITYIIVIIFIAYFFLNIKKINFTIFKKLLLFGLLSLLLSLYWLIFFFSFGSQDIANLVSRPIFESYQTVLNALTVNYSAWTGSIPAAFTRQAIPPFAYIIPGSVLVGLLLAYKRSKEILFWGLIVALGIFLTKSQNAPIGQAYGILFHYLPGFNLFRESSKFYILICLGYLVLLPHAFEVMTHYIDRYKKNRAWKPVPTILLLAIMGLVLFNARGLVTGSFSTLFVQRNIPSDYNALNEKIYSNKQVFKTLWYPRMTRWSYYDDNHARVSADRVADSTGLAFNSIDFKSTSTRLLLDSGNVKYVVVPVKDTSNDDDFFKYYKNDRGYFISQLNATTWLRKLDIGTSQLAVYENKDFTSYARTDTKLISVDNINDQANYNFAKNTLGIKQPSFINNSSHSNVPISDSLHDIFKNIGTGDLKNDTLDVSRDLKPDDTNRLYVDIDNPEYSYGVTNGKLTFNASSNNDLNINGSKAAPSTTKQLLSLDLDNTKSYSFSIGNTLYGLQTKSRNRNIGATNQPIKLFTTNSTTSLAKAAFTGKSAYNSQENCSRDGGIPQNDPSAFYTDGKQFVSLKSQNLTSCVESNKIQVKPGSYYQFAYSYAVREGRQAGYDLVFNDSAHTTISQNQTIADNSSNNKLSNYFEAPPGATNVVIKLKSLASTNDQTTFTGYSQIRLLPLSLVTDVASSYSQHYTKVDLNNAKSLTVDAPQGGSKNLVANPSLENGTWKNKVGDCNNYDNNPQLGMKTSTSYKTDGNKSLELLTTRHTACTSPNAINIKEGRTYLVSFDYQSPNSKQAGYYLSFDDPTHKSQSQKLTITSSAWNHFSTTVQAPYGATKMNIIVYGYADEFNSKTEINHYDNFHVSELPNVANRYYLVSSPKRSFSSPQSISYSKMSPAVTEIDVREAATPFYLNISEQYNSKWKLLAAKSFTTRDTLLHDGTGDTNLISGHYRLNGFLNAWYIDPSQVCKNQLNSCSRNSDGSYNIRLVAEFSPQRYFYVGLIISGATLLGCVGYLTKSSITSRRQSSTVKKSGEQEHVTRR